MNVIHSKKDEAKWFKETADATARKFSSVQAGKGSRPRTSVNSKAWQENAEELFSFKPFWQRREEKGDK